MPRSSSGQEASAAKGPRGSRIGDVVVAEGSSWEVVGLDPARPEAICRLVAGSGALRRFRARRIVNVERSVSPQPRSAKTAAEKVTV